MIETERIENSKKNLEMIVKGGQIILDSTSCMHDNFEKFISNITPMLVVYKRRLVVFNTAISELNTLAHHQNQDVSAKAKRAMETLMRLSNAQLLAVMNLASGQSVIAKMKEFLGKVNQTFITQKNESAKQVLNLNSSGVKIEVRQINQYGYLSPFRFQEEIKKTPDFKPCFQIVETSRMYHGSFSVVRSSHKYQEGDTVYILTNGAKGAVTLEKEIASGGEGVIYSVRNIPNIVIKIFKDDTTISDQRAFYSRKKTELLVNSSLKHNAICFPSSIVCDAAGNTIGYAMMKAEGVILYRILVGSQQTIRQYLGQNANRKETVRLCISIIEAVKFLHDNEIVIGDLNTENIMVKSPSEIFIIDTESFQLNEFPCLVGKDLYIPPERITKDFKRIDPSTFMRTKSDDMFALATILFQILMPPKEPYTKQDGSGNVLEDIKKGDFAYADPRKSKKETVAQAPKGNWRFCWSHISPQVRAMMYETFRRGEGHYTSEKRYSINEWLKAFQNYYAEIESGRVTEYDAMSLDLIPIRFIRSRKLTYGKCKNPNCKLDIVSTQDLKKYHGFCYKCAHTIIDEYTCPTCHDTEIVYRLTDQIANKPKPVKCWNCYQKERNRVFDQRSCTTCGTNFVITVGEKDSLEKKGLELPKRCPDCRSAAKMANNAVLTNPAPTKQNINSYQQRLIEDVIVKSTTKQKSFWEKLLENLGL